MPTVQTFAVRETDVSRHNGGTSGASLKPLRDDSALRTLSSLRGLRGATEGGSPIMPTDVSLSDSKCWNGGHEWVMVIAVMHTEEAFPNRVNPNLISIVITFFR